MFWNIIYAYITVNFYWSELDTLSGQIYCTSDIFGYCTFIKQSGFTAFWTLFISWSRQYSCANSLNISRQTFCVIGYKKDSGTRTFCIIECWTDRRIQISVCEHWIDHRINHRIDHRTDYRTDCWIRRINLTVSHSGQVS